MYIYIHTCTRMDIVCLQSFADPSYEAMVFLLGRIFYGYTFSSWKIDKGCPLNTGFATDKVFLLDDGFPAAQWMREFSLKWLWLHVFSKPGNLGCCRAMYTHMYPYTYAYIYIHKYILEYTAYHIYIFIYICTHIHIRKHMHTLHIHTHRAGHTYTRT